MDINTTQNETTCSVLIKGQIGNSTKFSDLKECINSCTSKKLEIFIQDSFFITSSLIGFLLQTAQTKNLALSIIAGDNRLYELFDTLGLVEVLNVTRSKNE